MNRKHDEEYKKLFSNPDLVRELLESFVHEPWVKNLDFEKAERVEKSYITKDLKQKESDLIWKIHYQGEEFYIYLLFEFQSSVDHFMALRVLRYLCEFYQNLIESEKLKKLPAVFPMVIYNGDKKWTAPVEFSDLVDKRSEVSYEPRFKYFKMVENEIPAEELMKLKNAVGALFLLETLGPYELRERGEDLGDFLRGENEETVKLFVDFLRNTLAAPKEAEAWKEIGTKAEALLEVNVMIETKIKEAEEKIYRRGRQEGRQEAEREMARKLKRRGIDNQSIAEMTGLPLTEVEKL